MHGIFTKLVWDHDGFNYGEDNFRLGSPKADKRKVKV